MTPRKRAIALIGTIAATLVATTAVGVWATWWDENQLFHHLVVEVQSAEWVAGLRRPFAELLQSNLLWATQVAAHVVLVMVATHAVLGARRRLAWLPTAVACLIFGAWVTVAVSGPGHQNVRWPVLNPPVNYFQDRLPALDLLHPGVLALAVAVGAVVVGGLVTVRTAPPTPERRRQSDAARAISWLVLVPAVLLVGFALWLVSEAARWSPSEPFWELLEWYAPTVVAAFLLVAVAFVASGSGMLPFAAVIGAGLTLTAPLLNEWYSGGDDVLLLTGPAILAAVVISWSRSMLARGFDELRLSPAPVPFI